MKRLFPLTFVILLAVLSSFTNGRPALALQSDETPIFTDQADAVRAAVHWLINNHQNDDGGYTSFSSGANVAPSDVGGTVDALLAIAAVGYNPAVPYPDHTTTPIDYLLANGDELTAYAGLTGGQAGKLLLALTAAGEDPRSFAGVDFVAALNGQLDESGAYNTSTAIEQSYALLGLAAVAEPVPDAAVASLLASQATEGELAGSWDDGFGTDGNVDSTALATMALLAAGLPATDDALVAAREYLVDAQLPDGSWPYGPGQTANVNSTAWAIQALQALGEDVVPQLTALLARQSESGAFQADFGQGPFDDFYSTVQAIPAAAGQPYPVTTAVDDVATSASNPPGWVGWLMVGLVVVMLAGTVVWLRRRGQL